MNPVLVLLCGFFGPVVMFFLWKKADKIRESKLWFAGAIGWIYASAYTVGAWSVILHKAGVELPPEEVGVPILFGAMILLILVVWYINIYRPYRKVKKEYG